MSQKKIKLFLTDVDGVLTDGGMYYTAEGDVMKKFSTQDGMGIHQLRIRGIKTGIITGEDTPIVAKRAEKLKMDYLYMGIEDKLTVAIEICKKENIDLSEVAFIGDDLWDIELLKNTGIAACPFNSTARVKDIPGIMILKNKGGEGVVREFIDYLLDNDLIYFN
jgi:3-deoxy-D-manno-octulosonate 8-phosphate phosphatase (KDO 8-P phosphatase)